MSKGGMQSEGVGNIPYCKCGLQTSSIKRFFNEGCEIAIHFGKKATYWHIYDYGAKTIKRTFKKPELWG